jgi:hypothetical protein
MSISVDRFASFGTWANGRSLCKPLLPIAPVVTRRECHYCGFVPADAAEMPPRCPKCGGSAWDRRTTRGGGAAAAAPEPEERCATVIHGIGRALSRRRHARSS